MFFTFYISHVHWLPLGPDHFLKESVTVQAFGPDCHKSRTMQCFLGSSSIVLSVIFFCLLNNVFHCFLGGPHTYTQVHTQQQTTQTVLTVAAGKPVHQTIPWAAL